MLDYYEARNLQREYQHKLDQLTIKARGGDNVAALDVIRTLTNLNLALRAVGWRLSEPVDGERQRLERL